MSTVVVAALISVRGTGFIIAESLENTQTGRVIHAVSGFALLAVKIDLVVQKRNIAERQQTY